MENPIRCFARQLVTRHPFKGFRTPVCSYVRDDLCRTCEQMSDQHRRSVKSVVLRRYDERLTNPVPVK